MSLSLLITIQHVFAQSAHQCGTMPNMEYLKSADIQLEKRRAEYENNIQNFIDSSPNLKKNEDRNVITIPTVVHIVWNTSVGNISDNDVNTMINMLNQDFSRTNPDTAQTPAIWKPIAANTGIQFCLAQQDSNAEPTAGIIRTHTTLTTFGLDNKVKFTAQGGDDAWNTTKYFNIWICPLFDGLGGYGEFPTAAISNTHGSVIDYEYFNSWVTSHEAGHCFDLFHIWGDDSGACSGTDNVSDTPNQSDASNDCPTFPALDSCSNNSPGYMFMNYMDYGLTSCKNIFTQGQSARCNAVLNTSPYNLLKTSPGCAAVSFVENDAQVLSIINPNGITCFTTFDPEILIRNRGNNNLTSFVLNYQIDAGPIQTYNWSGNLTSLSSSTILLSSIVTSVGAHTFNCFTILPNGLADGNIGNDSASSTFNVVLPGQTLPLIEGFEAATFPPAGWTIDNPDSLVTWARTTGAAKTGLASMWFNSINYTCNGCVDILQSPRLNLTSLNNPQLTFQVAYRMLSNPSLPPPNWSDTLRVDISTDCGKSWNNLYFKYSTLLTTITPSFSTSAFTPAANNWRLETINLGAYLSYDNVLFRWKATSDYENNLSVDDINITSSTAVNFSEKNNAFQIFPNPSDGNININVALPVPETIIIEITNVLGQLVLQKKLNLSVAGMQQVDLSSQPNGIYYINIHSETINYTNKLIINK